MSFSRFEIQPPGRRRFSFEGQLLAHIEGDDGPHGRSRLMLWRRPSGNWAAGRFAAGRTPLSGHASLIHRHITWRGRYVVERGDDLMWAEAMIVWDWSRLARQLTDTTDWIVWNRATREPSRWLIEDMIAARLDEGQERPPSTGRKAGYLTWIKSDSDTKKPARGGLKS